MDLAKIVRDGVALADRLTSDNGNGGLQTIVKHQSATRGTYGVTLGSAVNRLALVDEKTRKVRSSSGTEAESSHTITFLRRVTITVDDRITLPDGRSGAILDIAGFTDPASGRYVTTVALGIRDGNA